MKNVLLGTFGQTDEKIYGRTYPGLFRKQTLLIYHDAAACTSVIKSDIVVRWRVLLISAVAFCIATLRPVSSSHMMPYRESGWFSTQRCLLEIWRHARVQDRLPANSLKTPLKSDFTFTAAAVRCFNTNPCMAHNRSRKDSTFNWTRGASPGAQSSDWSAGASSQSWAKNGPSAPTSISSWTHMKVREGKRAQRTQPDGSLHEGWAVFFFF